MAAVTTATRGDETKMAPWGPGWGWRLRSRGTRGWCYVLIAMEILTGFASATHHSGGSSVRVAKNPSSREPYEFSSDYVKKALKAPLRPKTKWPDLTPYYSNFTDQYAAYSKKVHAGQIKILKNPSKTKMTVCANLEILDANDNNSYMGVFKCPNAFEPVQNTYCCGNEYSQYCCEPSDDSLMSKILGPMIVVPLFLFVLFLWGWSCCCKKKDAKEDDEPMDTKATENQPEEVKVVNSRPPSIHEEDEDRNVL